MPAWLLFVIAFILGAMFGSKLLNAVKSIA